MRKPPNALCGADMNVYLHFRHGNGSSMKYSLAAFMQKAAQCFVVEKLAAQHELEGLLYRPAF